ncbi:MAG: YrbL family protein [Hyphomicrobium sp.]
MTPIRLSSVVPIASGSIRDVYQHPADPLLLIKVVRQSTIEEKFGSGRPWYKIAKRRYRHLISYLREIREHIAQHALDGAHPAFLQNVVGLARTDVGLGLVVEAAVDKSGRLAPTLTSLVKSGRFDRAARMKLEQFFEDIIRSSVIVGDAHPSNIVYAHTPEDGDHFKLIDGVGFKTLIPLERFSKAANRWSKRQIVKKIRASVEALDRARAAQEPRAAEQASTYPEAAE